MAVKQVGVTTSGNIKKYTCETTDLPGVYPTAQDCGGGSTMVVIDASIHKIAHSLYFDGVNWNTI